MFMGEIWKPGDVGFVLLGFFFNWCVSVAFINHPVWTELVPPKFPCWSRRYSWLTAVYVGLCESKEPQRVPWFLANIPEALSKRFMFPTRNWWPPPSESGVTFCVKPGEHQAVRMFLSPAEPGNLLGNLSGVEKQNGLVKVRTQVLHVKINHISLFQLIEVEMICKVQPNVSVSVSNVLWWQWDLPKHFKFLFFIFVSKSSSQLRHFRR